MNTVDCIEVFVEVARGLSFSKAAERLGVSRSVVTKKVAWLEQEFETQLLSRNTKRVSLTESGHILLRNADALAVSLKNLKDLVRSPVQQPTGRIRVGAPPSFGAVHLVPSIHAFLCAYPDMRVSLLVDDGRSDLIAENIDLTVRIAPRLKDTNQIAYKIAVVPQVLVATRAYLERHGNPQHPDALVGHNCLIHSLKAPTSCWQFVDASGDVSTVRVGGSFNANLGEAILQFAKCDHGIAMHPRYMVDRELRSGSLQQVLSDYCCEGLDIYAVVQSKQFQPYKVRLFVEHLRRWFREIDWAEPTH